MRNRPRPATILNSSRDRDNNSSRWTAKSNRQVRQKAVPLKLRKFILKTLTFYHETFFVHRSFLSTEASSCGQRGPEPSLRQRSSDAEWEVYAGPAEGNRRCNFSWM